MKDPICRNCMHFRQHYGFSDGRIIRIHCGHCMQRQVISKNPDAKACRHFLPGETEEEKFITKQYLTKRILEYALHLDLVPDIPDAAAGTEWDIAHYCKEKNL